MREEEVKKDKDKKERASLMCVYTIEPLCKTNRHDSLFTVSFAKAHNMQQEGKRYNWTHLRLQLSSKFITKYASKEVTFFPSL